MLVWESGMREMAPDETYTLTLQMQYLAPTQVQMKVLYNLTPKTTNKYSEADYGTLGRLPYNNDGYTLNGTPSQERQMFQFFVGLPSNVRAIRVYDRALSEEEQIQNRFADIVKFYSLDLTQYLGMNEKMQDFVKASLTASAFNFFIASVLSVKTISLKSSSSAFWRLIRSRVCFITVEMHSSQQLKLKY
jgi:hypothetical protein